MMRYFLAQFVTAALFALVSVGALLPCPFLTSKQSCCPRPHGPDKKCPLSETLDNCPFFMTERKIGIAEATLETWFTSPVRLVAGVPGDGVFFSAGPMVKTVLRTSDRCVLNRVLLL